MTTIPGSRERITGNFMDRGMMHFNVMHPEFGAVGDGVVDDTIAIMDAISAAEDYGGTVYLPVPTNAYRITERLEIGGLSSPVRGVRLRGSRLSKGGQYATLIWDGETGNDSAMVDIRNAHGGEIAYLGFSGANKADYCVQIRHVPGDVEVCQHWTWDGLSFDTARKYNLLIGEPDGTASNGDSSIQNFRNCYFRRDPNDVAQTIAHVRLRSSNVFAVTFVGCQFDHGAYPSFGYSSDGGTANFYGMVSVGLDTCDIKLESNGTTDPPNICVYGWESQNTNFMRANLTGGAALQRNTVLSGVKHAAIQGTPGDAIQWNQTGGWGGLVLHACRFSEDVNVQSATARVWVDGVTFDNLNNAKFTTHPEVVVGNWFDHNGFVSKTLGALYIPVVATASLQPGQASFDGQILIENGGAGNQNLIIYANGERYRIDGGTAF